MAKRKKKGPLAKRARRDVRLAFQPELRGLKRAEEDVRDDYGEADTRIKEVYDALQQNLAPLTGQYDTAYQDIVGDLTGQLSGLSSMMGVTPAQEGATAEGLAGKEAFTGIGAGGLNILASDRLRNVGYQTSVQRQVEIERATLRKNYLEDMRDLVNDIRERKLDLRGDMKGAFVQRLDELRDTRFSRNLSRRELDIAETQFNKEFGLQKRGQRASTKFAQSQIDLTRDQAERKGDRKRIKPLRQDIKALDTQIEEAKMDGTIGAMNVPSLTKQRKRKKKRIKKIRRRDNPNY